MINYKGVSIALDEILASLKSDLKLRQVCQTVLNQKIIHQFVQEKAIVVTEAEIQAESDRWRYENRLFRANDTLNWLADQLITAEDWETSIRNRLFTEKLSHQLFDKEVEKYFAANQIDFDQVLLYRIVVPYAPLAQEIFYQIEEGEISFYEAAHIYDVEAQRRNYCGCEGKFYRWQLKPEVAAMVFSAVPGKVLGPVVMEQESHLLMVEEFVPAELTNDRRQEILHRIFNEWLVSEMNYLLHA